MEGHWRVALCLGMLGRSMLLAPQSEPCSLPTPALPPTPPAQHRKKTESDYNCWDGKLAQHANRRNSFHRRHEVGEVLGGLHLPRRLALFEERGHALACVGLLARPYECSRIEA